MVETTPPSPPAQSVQPAQPASIYSERETRLATRQRDVAPASTTLARTSGAPFWVLAVFLLIGIGAALALALGGFDSPGLLTPEQADLATGVVLFAMALVLLVFLGTIASVFGQVRRLRYSSQESESRRIADVLRQEEVNRQLRDEVAALRRREHSLADELAVRQRFASGAREGELHVLEIEGIGPHFATRLNGLGIITVNQLVAVDAERLAPMVHATPDQVREWQAMGRLVEVDGIGPQWAEALARVGVTGPDDLATRTPATLSASIAQLNRGPVRVTGTDPSPATVERWVRAAGGNPPAPEAERPVAAVQSTVPARRRSRSRTRSARRARPSRKRTQGRRSSRRTVRAR